MGIDVAMFDVAALVSILLVMAASSFSSVIAVAGVAYSSSFALVSVLLVRLLKVVFGLSRLWQIINCFFY